MSDLDAFGVTIEDDKNAKVAIGFAFVDAAVGRFYVGSLHDDCSRSALLTLLRQVAPQEVLYEIGGKDKPSLCLGSNKHSLVAVQYLFSIYFATFGTL